MFSKLAFAWTAFFNKTVDAPGLAAGGRLGKLLYQQIPEWDV
jgi:hypothetical protein